MRGGLQQWDPCQGQPESAVGDSSAARADGLDQGTGEVEELQAPWQCPVVALLP